MARRNQLAQHLIEGPVKTEKAIKLAAKAAQHATALYNQSRSNTFAITNGQDEYKKRERTHFFEEMTKAASLDDVKPFPEPEPDLKTAQLVMDAAERHMKLKDRELEVLIDYDETFEAIEDAWDEIVNWRAQIEDESKVTLAEAEKLNAKANTAKPKLLELSNVLAQRKAETRQERKTVRRWQRDRGVPVSLREVQAHLSSSELE